MNTSTCVAAVRLCQVTPRMKVVILFRRLVSCQGMFSLSQLHSFCSLSTVHLTSTSKRLPLSFRSDNSLMFHERLIRVFSLHFPDCYLPVYSELALTMAKNVDDIKLCLHIVLVNHCIKIPELTKSRSSDISLQTLVSWQITSLCFPLSTPIFLISAKRLLYAWYCACREPSFKSTSPLHCNLVYSISPFLISHPSPFNHHHEFG